MPTAKQAVEARSKALAASFVRSLSIAVVIAVCFATDRLAVRAPERY
jgi:hypothetical protein